MESLIRPQRGFTLVELLVVVLVLAVTLSLATLSLTPDPRRSAGAEAMRLGLLLQHAMDEARTAAVPLAWSAEPTGYRFWRRDGDGEWRALDDEFLRARQLPADVRLQTVRVEERPLAFGERLPFAANGVNPPFRIQLAAPDVRVEVAADALGRVVTRDPDAKP